MLDELLEVTKMAEGYGFEIVATTEHHLHSEGLEMGHVPSLNAYLALNTSHVNVGPIGYVLASWNPLKLAIEIAWLDQLTKGRTIVGMARGYQSRWLNQMAQHLNARGVEKGLEEPIDVPRRAFDEVYDFLKLAWGVEPFAFDGHFWEFPYPAGEGTPWPAHEWTARMGTPGEVEDGKVVKISVVPKRYQRPHPPLFAAFSASESTVAWAAREDIRPVILGSSPERGRTLAELYVSAAASVGRTEPLGNKIALSHATVFGSDMPDALRRARAGRTGAYFVDFGGVFGFWEALRVPGDEERWPAGEARIPESEWTVERIHRSGHLIAGTPADVRRRLDEIVETMNPEYFVYGPDQGVSTFEQCKEQLRIFGEQVMPHYLSS